MLYAINPAVEVVPARGGRLCLRCPILGASLEAEPYHANLLQQLAAPQTIDGLLERFPRDAVAARAFLERCAAEGLLLPVGEDGIARLPDRGHGEGTVAGTPRWERAAPSAFAFLGVPFDRHVTGLAGARFGPAAVRSASEGTRYQLHPHTLRPRGFHDYASGRSLLRGVTLADAGDVLVLPGEPPSDSLDRVTRAVAELVEAGSIPLIIGGDHSISYAALRALPTERLGVLHLDAHTDLGGAYVEAGLHHGNVFSFVLERLEFVERLVQVGLRGVVDAGDHEPSEAVHQIGLDRLREEGLEAVLEAMPDDLPWWVSIDIDVLDPSFAPATGTPVPNGMRPDELKLLLSEVLPSRRVVGADLVEVARSELPHDGTAGLAFEALLTVADGVVAGLQAALSDTDTAGGDTDQ